MELALVEIIGDDPVIAWLKLMSQINTIYCECLTQKWSPMGPYITSLGNLLIWARCCMCWATERRSWYEQEQGKRGTRRLSLRPLLLTARREEKKRRLEQQPREEIAAYSKDYWRDHLSWGIVGDLSMTSMMPRCSCCDRFGHFGGRRLVVPPEKTTPPPNMGSGFSHPIMVVLAYLMFERVFPLIEHQEIESKIKSDRPFEIEAVERIRVRHTRN
ncbi:hypothetical protein Sjap_009832 [Stephania japonica]|uniref:Uncharacterized protein n=1 Tax=Stephania japonica TaxID=461633 RepID=A0AAP0JA17_9MAGN